MRLSIPGGRHFTEVLLLAAEDAPSDTNITERLDGSLARGIGHRVTSLK